MALNAKQKLFVKEYLVDKNGTQAAIRAGYSKKSANQIAAEHMAKPGIRAAIDAGLAKLERDADRRAIEAGLTKERWIKELARIGFANIDDVAVVEKGQIKVFDTNQRDASLGAAIQSLEGGKFGPKVRLHPKQAALDTLGRALGWVKNDIGISNTGGEPLVILTMPANGREAPKEKPVETSALEENKSDKECK